MRFTHKMATPMAAHQSASEYCRTSHILDTLAEHERGTKAGEKVRCHGSAQVEWDWRVLSDSLPAFAMKKEEIRVSTGTLDANLIWKRAAKRGMAYEEVMS